MSRDDLRKVEDEAIRRAVRMQEDIGLRGATDGEFRRSSWHMDFLYQIGGVAKVPGTRRVEFRNEQGTVEFTVSSHAITKKLKLDRVIFGEHFTFLKSVTKATPKLTIPSPNMMHLRSGRATIDPSVYADMEMFWYDLAQAYIAELQELARLGCAYLQFDDISLAYLGDPAQREIITSLGGDGQRQHLQNIRVLNSVLAHKPAGMTVCTHMCRGNFRSAWAASGSYDFVAEPLFSELNVDGFFLEYDDARSGSFEPLRFVPKDKRVVLGLVTTKKGALEKKEELKRRIDEAARYLPLEQLCLSPQCGFSSTVEGNALTLDEEMAKLRLVVETAREVWGDA